MIAVHKLSQLDLGKKQSTNLKTAHKKLVSACKNLRKKLKHISTIKS